MPIHRAGYQYHEEERAVLTDKYVVGLEMFSGQRTAIYRM